MNDRSQFIGTGWSFPPSFDKATGTTVMSTGEEDIKGSLHCLFSTSIGERCMLESYGSNLRDFVMDPMNRNMQAYIKKLVEDAILYFEPRISLENVVLTTIDEEGRIDIDITFTIDATNSRANYVYPFYIRQRTNV